MEALLAIASAHRHISENSQWFKSLDRSCAACFCVINLSIPEIFFSMKLINTASLH